MIRSSAILLLLLAACGEPQWSRDQVAVARSPDGALEAVLFEENGGATTSFEYEVVVQPTGRPQEAVVAGDLYGAVRSPCAYGLNLRWTGAGTLEIGYQGAQRGALEPRVVVRGRPVAVAEKAGELDRTAPCGGMLYNLGR